MLGRAEGSFKSVRCCFEVTLGSVWVYLYRRCVGFYKGFLDCRCRGLGDRG